MLSVVASIVSMYDNDFVGDNNDDGSCDDDKDDGITGLGGISDGDEGGGGEGDEDGGGGEGEEGGGGEDEGGGGRCDEDDGSSKRGTFTASVFSGSLPLRFLVVLALKLCCSFK